MTEESRKEAQEKVRFYNDVARKLRQKVAIKESIVRFAEENNLPFEIKSE